jgi:hypothetical protein
MIIHAQNVIEYENQKQGIERLAALNFSPLIPHGLMKPALVREAPPVPVENDLIFLLFYPFLFLRSGLA